VLGGFFCGEINVQAPASIYTLVGKADLFDLLQIKETFAVFQRM
jgi:hypothetical protein